MANQEHLDILRQGVETWNKWRKSSPNLTLDYMASANLSGANLGGADLGSADLRWADLNNANLIKADLGGADLGFAKLQYANLRYANLSFADLSMADLSMANLSNTDLFSTNLTFATLCHADFKNAKAGTTMFVGVDLSNVKGLDTLQHMNPSVVDIKTIYESKGYVSEIFLRRVGIPEDFITYMRSIVGKAVEYYSCFISYSSKDEAFAKRLYADLQSNNVRCWFAPEDLKIGDKFWHRIDESIRLYDKLMVVLSEHSVQSDWVEREAMAALEKEKQGKTVLFPITLDDAVKDCTAPWAAGIRRSRHIGDFEQWKDHDAYQVAFERLLRDLKAQS